jgi:uncharacterized membrane protein YidH (DUF202 family)
MGDPTFDVEHFIALDRRSIVIYSAAGAALLAFGLFAILGFAQLVASGGNSFDTISKGVGVLVSLTGLFPFSNCYARWERIKTLQAMQRHPEALDAATEQELVRRLYAKFLGV